MKHRDFLKSLKELKSKLTLKHKTSAYSPHTSKPHSVCICKDSDGQHKYLYISQQELEYMLASKSVTLKSYPCPYEKGWHLTRG